MENSFDMIFKTAVVETDKGLVHGYEYDGMSIFKGIPYARSKRFQRPRTGGALGRPAGSHWLWLCMPPPG